jgi:cyclophilin family peptidyl-prolyl cis-trans isomerase
MYRINSILILPCGPSSLYVSQFKQRRSIMHLSLHAASVHSRSHTLTAALSVLGMAILFSGCAQSEPPACSACIPQEEKTMEAEPAKPAPATPPVVIIETSHGEFELTLWDDKAPVTVSNFLAYVDSGFYDDLIFHRVIKGFMVQGGGFDAKVNKKQTRAPIKNEASHTALNKRGTIAMARTSDVNSATAQFFVNLVDNAPLDHRDTTPRGYGYCAFGEVTAGMDVVDAIAALPTGRHGMHANMPKEQVLIKAMRRQ